MITSSASLNDQSNPPRVVIVMPVYDDSRSAATVIAQLDRQLASLAAASILVVDDGSNPPVRCEDLRAAGATSPVSLLTLRRNLGHQRAIAVGLSYVAECLHADAVVVMDADGEDRVEDVPRLLRAWLEKRALRIVFAARRRRSESVLFRLSYHSYRAIHWLLTGIPVRFGNFSVVPSQLLPRLVVSSELWNHYAASVLKTKVPYTSIPVTRGRRVEGRSRMNVVALVVHGLSALSVFSEIVGVRLLVASACGLALMSTVAALVAAGYLYGALHLPYWAFAAGGFSLLVGLEVVTGCSLLALAVLGRRTGSDFVPSRDYRLFIESVCECSGHRP